MAQRTTLLLVLTILLAALPVFAQEQVLFSFQEDNNGAYPQSRVVLDPQGNIYGATNLGGANGQGTVFQMKPATGGGYTYTVLHTFTGTPDGGSPRAGLLLDKSGNLFGTASGGGSSFFGTVFELSPNAGGFAYTVIHDFKGGSDGGFPTSDLISDSNGVLYGTTAGGGGSANCTFGCGTVFALRRNTSGKWTLRILYKFQGGTDGAGPSGLLAMDASGNLYGTTIQGGSTQCSGGCGTAFRLTPAAQGLWTKQTLSAFADKQHGWSPYSGLTLDSAGNLYGTTSLGGNVACNPPNGCGTLFKINRQGQQTIIHRFGQNSTDGTFPMAGLIPGASGHLLGTTYSGGQIANGCSTGCGIVYDLTLSTGKLTLIHAFDGADGAFSEAPLFWDGASIFGTTLEGGTGFAGTVFEVTP